MEKEERLQRVSERNNPPPTTLLPLPTPPPPPLRHFFFFFFLFEVGVSASDALVAKLASARCYQAAPSGKNNTRSCQRLSRPGFYVRCVTVTSCRPPRGGVGVVEGGGVGVAMKFSPRKRGDRKCLDRGSLQRDAGWVSYLCARL